MRWPCRLRAIVLMVGAGGVVWGVSGGDAIRVAFAIAVEAHDVAVGFMGEALDRAGEVRDIGAG